MALLRKSLIEVRSRGLTEGDRLVFSIAKGPDTVFPPFDELRAVAKAPMPVSTPAPRHLQPEAPAH